MAKYKIDDRLRYFGESDQYTTKGESYIISEVHEDYVCINDETGDTHELTFGFIPTCFEHVTEESPEVPDLIANLGRRLSEVEDQLERTKERKYYEEMVEAYSDVEEESPEDVVNSPQHYKRGKFETIEVIEHITAGYDDPFIAYCVGNAAKYIDRAPFKHESPAECLRKAVWYLTRAVDSVEATK